MAEKLGVYQCKKCEFDKCEKCYNSKLENIFSGVICSKYHFMSAYYKKNTEFSNGRYCSICNNTIKI
jgi:hypothetical protein